MGVNPQRVNHELYARLEQAKPEGFNLAQIDQILQQGMLDKILKNFPLIENYLRNNSAVFQALVGTQWGKSYSTDVMPMENFKEYWSKNLDTRQQGTHGVEWLDFKYFLNPQLLVQEGYCSPQQVECVRQLMTKGCWADSQAARGQASWLSEEEAQAPASGAGKAYSSGGAYEGKAYSSGSEAKAYGSGVPPPPPPPGGGDRGPGNYPPPGGYTALDRDFIVNMTRDTPFYGLFGPLIDREERARGLYLGIYERMEKNRKQREMIFTDINNLDLTKPEDQRKFYLLRQQVDDSNTSDKENYDMMQRLNNAQNEFTALMSKLMEMTQKAMEGIVSRVGGK